MLQVPASKCQAMQISYVHASWIASTEQTDLKTLALASSAAVGPMAVTSTCISEPQVKCFAYDQCASVQHIFTLGLAWANA